MTSLERRYRDLLRWSQWHRRLHEQEMLAVLLQSAAPAQQRPALSDALDLIRGGLRVRIHHVIGAPSAPHWRRAVNLAALLGPLALFTRDLAGTASFAARWLLDARSGIRIVNSPGHVVVQLLAFALPYLLIAALAWHRQRRLAAACAWTWVFAHAYLVTTPPHDPAVTSGLDLAPHHVTLDTGMAYIGGIALVESAHILLAILATLAIDPKAASLSFGKTLTWMTAGFAALLAGNLLVFVMPDDSAPMACILLLAVLLPAAAVAIGSASGRRVAFILIVLLPGNPVHSALALTAIAMAIITRRATRRAAARDVR
ncbi:hypothetical protein [[Actinomadura] parvosata]|uniref:hypothetical protein n=1 Tax=[Actinomadura] parvosata TaxID=1955412 RepID=UPI0016489C97